MAAVEDGAVEFGDELSGETGALSLGDLCLCPHQPDLSYCS